MSRSSAGPAAVSARSTSSVMTMLTAECWIEARPVKSLASTASRAW
ncbi:hypothetical protein [Streptomyces marincola]|nr:hypothetical protein [Streptomyces marincola]UCM88853.1 hypothetical protein LC193_13325 [Streptomyces marincola]